MGNCSSSIVTPMTMTKTYTKSYNSIEIKSVSTEPKCKECGFSAKEFNVVSRDGNTNTKMYYCNNCANHWKH
jgi:DNA-directed RNA polymerase subunit M/transcription elongation factor TFIIS